jgi:hypothetical protein
VVGFARHQLSVFGAVNLLDFPGWHQFWKGGSALVVLAPHQVDDFGEDLGCGDFTKGHRSVGLCAPGAGGKPRMLFHYKVAKANARAVASVSHGAA